MSGRGDPDRRGEAQRSKTESPQATQAVAEDRSCFLVTKRDGRWEPSGQAHAEFGHRLPSSHSEADGVFARWHWNGTQLVVDNDRYGFYPLFWFRTTDGGVCVSPSLVALLEHGAPTTFDVDALAVFFRLGYFLGEDTPFSAIRVVPPNAVFVWENGGIECRGRLPAVPDMATISRDDAIDRYIELFARAMAKRAPATDNFAVPISGGRDSRHILLELHRTGFAPAACVSAIDNPPDPNVDPEVAVLLCNALGFDLVVVDQRLSLLDAQLRKNRETHFCANAHGWYLALADYLNGRFDAVYDGIAGDVLSQSSFLHAHLDATFRTRDVGAIAGELLARYGASAAAVQALLKGELRRAADPQVANQRLAQEVRKHIDAHNPIASFIFWNRTRREIALAPCSLLHGVRHVHAPYLDHDLFDFMATLPAAMLMDRSFHDAVIARAYPGFAHIPYADNRGAPRTDDRHVRARFLAEAARRFALRKPSTLMKNLVPRARMLVGALSRGRINPSISPLIMYLDQLESARNGRL